jgi:hypothetical protein
MSDPDYEEDTELRESGKDKVSVSAFKKGKKQEK